MNQPGCVVFNYPEWLAQYPEFGTVTQPQAQSYFNRATLYCDNTPCSPITDLFQRTILLNQVTAHMAKLFAGQNGQPPNTLVGRINSASQGSVSVQAAYTEPTSDLQAFFGRDHEIPYRVLRAAADRRECQSGHLSRIYAPLIGAKEFRHGSRCSSEERADASDVQR